MVTVVGGRVAMRGEMEMVLTPVWVKVKGPLAAVMMTTVTKGESSKRRQGHTRKKKKKKGSHG